MSEFDQFCNDMEVKIACTFLGRDSEPTSNAFGRPGASWDYDLWRAALTFQNRRLTSQFRQGTGHEGKEPSAASVLSCLISDADCGSRSFEEFCSDLGYDADSRTAHKTWKACKRMTAKIERFLGSDRKAFEQAARDY